MRALAFHQCVPGSIIIFIVIIIIIQDYIKYGTGGITSLFRRNAVKDCTPVSLNRALLRLSITPVRVHMNVVPRSTGNTNSGTEN